VVENPRTETRADGLRPLGEPHAAEVQADAAGVPVSVRRGHGWLAVEQVEEEWRIADGWWRDEAIDRTYFRVVVEDGRRLTLFRNDGASAAPGSAWYEQQY
jgi:hypothetical protein